MHNRTIIAGVRRAQESAIGRIIVFTGARQTCKTTLARQCFPGYTFLSIEDPVMRQQYSALTAAQWHSLYPQAVLDKIQKEPALIESVKSVYDQWSDDRYVLTGSSQLLLLEKAPESLAGRRGTGRVGQNGTEIHAVF
jgi:predicted AAA+ superfamily ATPase